jgi:hypothetical protein
LLEGSENPQQQADFAWVIKMKNILFSCLLLTAIAMQSVTVLTDLKVDARTLTFFFLALMGGILALPSHYGPQAEDTKEKFAVRDVGTLACSQLIAALNSKDDEARRESVLLFVSWIDDYLSHINRGEPSSFDIVPFVQTQDMLAVVLTQCQTTQDALVETVVLQTAGALGQARVHNDSPVVTVHVGKLEGSLRKETVVAIQNKLIERKLIKGSANGEFNDTSRKALAAFQESVKLNGTGFPDVDTIIRLLLS